MPKMKTNKAAAKRLRRTGTGKLRRYCEGKRHLLSCKSTKRKRNLRKPAILAPGDHARLSHLVP